MDVVGNHTFVSIDAVSLSAGGDEHSTPEITDPAENFLKNVQASKRKAVARELSFLAGKEGDMHFKHEAEDLAKVDFKNLPTLDPGSGAKDLPTILLTHVPLYRAPGTPCGPQREHWPPATPPKGQPTPVIPDDRNAISISKGYQYQNVLSEADSVRVVSAIGNVVSVFSGDDHDYCELVHPENRNHAREITVKSTSMAMGVRKPGFLLLSMWNPIAVDGSPLHSTPSGHGSTDQAPVTMESHLCLIPDEIGILINYGFLVALTILVLIIRAILVPVLHLTPFSLPLTSRTRDDDESLLPTSSKPDVKRRERSSTLSNSSSNHFSSTPALAPRSSAARTPRSISPAPHSNGYGLPQPLINGAGYTASYVPPVFTDQEDDFKFGKDKSPPNGGSGGMFGGWSRNRSNKPDTKTKLVLREVWQSVWRVTWVVVLWYCWLGYFG